MASGEGRPVERIAAALRAARRDAAVRTSFELRWRCRQLVRRCREHGLDDTGLAHLRAVVEELKGRGFEVGA